MSTFQEDLLSTTSNLPNCLWSDNHSLPQCTPCRANAGTSVVFRIRRGLSHPLGLHVHSSQLPNKKLVGVRTRSSAKTLCGTMSVPCKSTSKMAEDMSFKKIFETIFLRRSLLATKSLQTTCCQIQIFLPTHKRFFPFCTYKLFIASNKACFITKCHSFWQRDCIVFSGVGCS